MDIYVIIDFTCDASPELAAPPGWLVDELFNYGCIFLTAVLHHIIIDSY